MLAFPLMLATLAGTYAKSRLTDNCPSSINQWKRQERLFSCPADAPYHCILKYNTSQLYEICLPVVTIGPGIVGCPWIVFHQGAPTYGSKNSDCPVTNPECPPSNHKGYLSNQLFNYPACFMQRSARLPHSSDDVVTSQSNLQARTSNHSSDLDIPNGSQRKTFIVVGVSAAVVIVVIPLVVFCLLKRVKTFRSHRRRSENGNIDTIVLDDSAQCNSEIGDGTPICTVEEEALISSNGDGTPICTVEEEALISPNAAANNNGSVSQKGSSIEKITVTEMKDWSDEEETSNNNSDETASDLTCRIDVATSLNQHNVTNNQSEGNNDEDVVQRVFKSILEMSDGGVVSYQQLLMHIVEKEDCLDICKDLENILKGNRHVFRLLEDESICFVIAYLSSAEICENYNPSSIAGECVDPKCSKFHICSLYVRNLCRKPHCTLSHKYGDAHNMKVKERLRLCSYTDSDINQILRNTYPKICSTYGCDTIEECPYLHVCSKFCFGKCFGLKCRFGHSFRTEHNTWIFKAYGISVDEVWSGSPIARAIAKNNGSVSQKESGLEKNDTASDPTCRTDVGPSINQHDITNNQPEGNNDEDVVQRVFKNILEMSDDGVVSYSKLLMHFVEKEDCSNIVDNLENILKGSRHVFRLLEDDIICFVIAYRSDAEMCADYNPLSLAGECVDPNCSKFHICTFYAKRLCRNPQCKLLHTYEDAHNMKVKERLHLRNYTDADINKILLNRYPKICSSLGCDMEVDCPYLHICSKFCFGRCAHGSKCRFKHSFRTEHNAWILDAYGISEDEIWSGSPKARKLTIAKRI